MMQAIEATQYRGFPQPEGLRVWESRLPHAQPQL